MSRLLSRSDFSSTVLARASGACCVPECSRRAVDAHHILNRNLFVRPEEFGGYFVENGAQLCSDHHYHAELTSISTEDLWSWCGVTPIYPIGWDTSKSYDAWGNEIISEYQMAAGPMFEDGGFQKVMKLARIEWKFSASY